MDIIVKGSYAGPSKQLAQKLGALLYSAMSNHSETGDHVEVMEDIPAGTYTIEYSETPAGESKVTLTAGKVA